MRIIAGRHKGRRLASPPDNAIRPTSDRTREALFNLLLHGFDPSPVIGQRIMDLCCGSGALGLEALSRGAAQAIFVDSSKQALELAQANAAGCKETANCRFILGDAQRLPKADGTVGLVMIDAPYRSGLIVPAYASLSAQGWLREGTVIACEQHEKEPVPELENLELVSNRHYGKARIIIWVRR